MIDQERTKSSRFSCQRCTGIWIHIWKSIKKTQHKHHIIISIGGVLAVFLIAVTKYLITTCQQRKYLCWLTVPGDTVHNGREGMEQDQAAVHHISSTVLSLGISSTDCLHTAGLPKIKKASSIVPWRQDCVQLFGGSRFDESLQTQSWTVSTPLSGVLNFPLEGSEVYRDVIPGSWMVDCGPWLVALH